MKKLLLASIFSSGVLHLASQTYIGTTDSIYDVTVNSYYATVTGLTPSTIDTTNFGLETVQLNLTHTWDGDLDIKLIAPDGTTILLSSGNGGSGDNYTNTVFDANASTNITANGSPFTGSYKPQGQMGLVNDNQNGNGTWVLQITDMAAQDAGNLLSWSITFGNNPASYFSLSSSNLPIIVINTNNQTIVDAPDIPCDMGIIYNGTGNRNYMTDPFNDYNGRIGIQFHGSSSQGFPKKTYGLTTWDVNNNAIDSSLLGMPKEHDWILSASYSDKSLMNNQLTYFLSRQMGWYAPRWEYVELVVNGEYQGVYILMEKIKRDKHRVDIKKMQPTDIYGDSLTGGYIIKIDKTTGSGGGGWVSPYAPDTNINGQTLYYQYDYPSDVNIVPQQQTYIQQYVDSFETALAGPNFMDTSIGYRHFIDMNSLVDYFLINELSRNVDGYRLSTYLYKNRYSKGGKFIMGPTWDYDIAWGNADYCNGSSVIGWAYDFATVCSGDGYQIPFWWDRLLLDSNFTNRVRCRWTELSGSILNPVYLDNWCDSVATYLNEGTQRNFYEWPILGTYVWPNPSPIPNSYLGEVDELKNWINARWAWMDQNLPGTLSGCNLTDAPSTTAETAPPAAYPNPFSSAINLSIYQKNPVEVKMELYNAMGQLVQPIQSQMHNGGNQTIVFIPDAFLPTGVYLLRITAGTTVWTQQLSHAQ